MRLGRGLLSNIICLLPTQFSTSCHEIIDVSAHGCPFDLPFFFTFWSFSLFFFIFFLLLIHAAFLLLFLLSFFFVQLLSFFFFFALCLLGVSVFLFSLRLSSYSGAACFYFASPLSACFDGGAATNGGVDGCWQPVAASSRQRAVRAASRCGDVAKLQRSVASAVACSACVTLCRPVPASSHGTRTGRLAGGSGTAHSTVPVSLQPHGLRELLEL